MISAIISTEFFLEDIGFSVDGGLNANMVNNYSFDGVYLDRQEDPGGGGASALLEV